MDPWSILATLLVSAVTAWVTSRLTRKQQEAEWKARTAEARAAEVRARADTAAEQILHLIREIDQLLNRFIPRSPSDIVAQSDRAELRRLVREIDTALIYMPSPVREHVEPIPRLVASSGERICGMGYLDEPAQLMTRIVCRAAREAIGQYIRGEPVGALSNEIHGYLQVLADVERHDEDEIERQTAEPQSHLESRLGAGTSDSTLTREATTQTEPAS
ncbi:hypothetical protein [Micropruina glycogenica]|uniref:Uncharacterized protein n=1 Tax=Micropruina glycogenica TaxID=75385 RepID=A0A2N9JCZ9_9ACTN|nr:hypothetical protein [Micropruina glycogenica]SPD85254.1 protein of unknown function [Micropruina glycogenica]